MKRDELSGRKFNRLTVIRFSHIGRHGHTFWVCMCDCGKQVTVAGRHLKDSGTKSCGCYSSELHRIGSRGFKHGHSPRGNFSRTYRIWTHMISRCKYESDDRYYQYGGRGITVCDQWSGENGFASFLADMGEAPKGLSIDRIDNNKGYCKDNCRWATAAEQNRNTTRNILITFNGKTQCVQDWAIQLGIKYQTLSYRLKHWSIEKALTTPIDVRYSRKRGKI